jgi:hypothetical protein
MSDSTSGTQSSASFEQLQDLYRDLAALEAAYRAQKICFYRPRTWSHLGDRGKQDRFHRRGNVPIRLVLGDNRSGKTVAGVCEAIAHSLGVRPWLPDTDPDYIVRLPNGRQIPVPNFGRVIAQSGSLLVQNIFPKFEEWAPSGWFSVQRDTRGVPVKITWTNGSVIYFMTDDQEDKLFEGTNGHWFWGDEPFGYAKYVGLKRGLVDFGGHCWLTLTPLDQFWIEEVIQSRENDPDGEVEVFEFSIWDNCDENGGVLSRKAIEGFISDLRPDERAARVGRKWRHLTGRVFPEWNPEPPYWVQPFEIPEHWPRVEFCDPHGRKPMAVMWAAVSPDNRLIIYRDLFDPDLRTVDQVCDEIRRTEGWSRRADKWVRTDDTENVVLRLIDWSSREDERTSGTSIWQMFVRNGLGHALANKRNAASGFDAVHSALMLQHEWDEPGIVVFNTCAHVKQNFLKFVWDDWQTSKQRDLKGEKQEVRKINDDFIDLIRYFFQTGLTFRRLMHDTASSLQGATQSRTAFWRTNE